MTELPPYRHDPGRTPHPTRDPAGHSFGRSPEPAQPFDPARAGDDAAFQRGLELFDAGYFWEAHEAWEGPWRASPRGSISRTLLQGLIQVAAAMLKRRAGRLDAASRLAQRGLWKLERCEREHGDCAGLAIGRFVVDVRAALADADAPAPAVPRVR